MPAIVQIVTLISQAQTAQSQLALLTALCLVLGYLIDVDERKNETERIIAKSRHR